MLLALCDSGGRSYQDGRLFVASTNVSGREVILPERVTSVKEYEPRAIACPLMRRTGNPVSVRLAHERQCLQAHEAACC